MSDKCSALEAVVLKISLSSTKTQLHWVHSEAQLADGELRTRSQHLRGGHETAPLAHHFPTRRMRSARKRKIEGLGLLEPHSDSQSNGDELNAPVHQQQSILSRIREPKSRLFEEELNVPKQTGLVAAKGACEWLRSCLQLVTLTQWFFVRRIPQCSLVLCSPSFFVGVLRNLLCVTPTLFGRAEFVTASIFFLRCDLCADLDVLSSLSVS